MGSREREPDVDCIVVGGGVAGLSAAEVLKKAGISVKLLEARDRLGGRAFTRKYEDGVLEMGAQWLHGGCHANNMFNLAASRGLLGPRVRLLNTWGQGHTFTSSGRVIDEEIAELAMETLDQIEKMENVDENMSSTFSFEDYFLQELHGKLNNLDDWSSEKKEDFLMCMRGLQLAVSEYNGDSLQKTSALLYSEGTELPGGDVIVPGGIGGLVDVIAENLPDIISMNTEVTHIDWSGDQGFVTVTTNSSSFTCHHVIVTIPLGVLKMNHNQLFTPGLGTEKIKALTSLNEGSLSKIFLEWSQPWWLPGDKGINFVWTKEELVSVDDRSEWYKSIFNMSPVEGQPSLLLFWVVGDAAKEVDCIDDKQIMDTMTWLLRKFTGDLTLPSPIKVLRHSWTKDTLTLGAYSSPGLESKAGDFSTLISPSPGEDDPRLLLAGEHTHPQYWSFLHGARMSGVQQANRIMKHRNTIVKNLN